MKTNSLAKAIYVASIPASLVAGAVVVQVCEKYIKKNWLTTVGKWTLGYIAAHKAFDVVSDGICDSALVKYLVKSGIIEAVEEDQNGGSENAGERRKDYEKCEYFDETKCDEQFCSSCSCEHCPSKKAES